MAVWKQVVLPVLAGLCLLLSLSSWVLSSPIGSAPDDTYHLPTIWCSWGEHESCSRAESGSFTVPQSIGETCLIQNSVRSGACTYLQTDDLVVAPQLAYVETAEEKETNVPTRLSGNAVYHRTLRLLVGPDAASSALLMRFVNIFVASVLLAWALLVSRPRPRRALALAWLVGSVPLGMFILASTNPSAWAVAGVGTYWAFLLAVLKPRQDLSGARALALAGLFVSAVAAIGARADTLVFLGASTVAVVILSWKSIRYRGPLLAGVGVVAVALVALMAVTSIGDRMSAVVQAIFTSQGSNGAIDAGADKTAAHILELPSFLFALIGGQAPTFAPPTAYLRGLSWLDTGIPSLVGIFMLSAVVVVATWGLGSYNARKLVALSVACITLVASILIPLESSNYSPEAVLQPRYFLPMFYVIIGLVALRSFSSGRPRIIVMALVVTLAALSNAAAQLSFLRRFTNGEAMSWTQLELEPSWWWLGFPVSPMGVWVVGAIAFLGFGACVALIARGDFAGVNRKATEQPVQRFEPDHVR